MASPLNSPEAAVREAQFRAAVGQLHEAPTVLAARHSAFNALIDPALESDGLSGGERRYQSLLRRVLTAEPDCSTIEQIHVEADAALRADTPAQAAFEGGTLG